MNASDPRWIRRYHPGPAPVTLVCLPHAGGSASFFHPVSAALAGAVDVVAVQYPGRQDRHDEPQVESIAALAAAVAGQVAALGSARPFALFGHSMGALVGYEAALLLESAGIPPAHLFASGRRAPSRTREEAIHRLDDDGLVDHVRRLDGDTGVADALVDPDVRAMALPALRADYRAVETYPASSGPPLRCPVTVLTGRDDPVVSADEAAAWEGHTLGGFEVLTYPGRHFFVATHRAAVVAEIRGRLARVPAPLG